MERKMLEFFQNLKIREKKEKLKIGVIAGGISPEREVSLVTGNGIYQSLLRTGYKTIFIDFDNNNFDMLKSVDIAFIALHGKFGEDGTVQGLLELLKIPYTGSGVLSSAAAMDKIFSKRIFIYENIVTSPYIEVAEKNIKNIEALKSKVIKNIGFPVIIKPNRGGSSIGVTILNDDTGLKKAVETAFIYDDKIIIEKYIKGKLLTVSIIGKDPVALPIIEIKPKSGFYDYRSKYTPGLTDYIVPAEIDDIISKNISDIALRCYKSLNCEGFSRIDFILGDDGIAYALEVNTIPGMTPTSLVPKAADACGINYDLLVEIILDCASLKL
jgi:D-alanine-D-alanine ligase